MLFISVNEFLKIGLEKQLGDYQDGFRVGRGTIKASWEVVKNLRKKGIFTNLILMVYSII